MQMYFLYSINKIPWSLKKIPLRNIKNQIFESIQNNLRWYRNTSEAKPVLKITNKNVEVWNNVSFKQISKTWKKLQISFQDLAIVCALL